MQFGSISATRSPARTPERDQRVGELVDLALELAVGQPPARVDQPPARRSQMRLQHHRQVRADHGLADGAEKPAHGGRAAGPAAPPRG